MNFKELNDKIPYVIGKQEYVVTMRPYPGIQLAFPGRHQQDTDPKGGDFVVRVTCKEIGWSNHPFTHQDIFDDLQEKCMSNRTEADKLMTAYTKVVYGDDPNNHIFDISLWKGTLDPNMFLKATQCLAIAEHRRYHRFEKGQLGGRFLPARFASGIVEGLWTAHDASAWQRKGRPGLDMMIKMYGRPQPLRKRAEA